MQAPCPRCRTERGYFFRADGDLLDRRPGIWQPGGPEPSTVLTAAELAAAIEHLAPQATTDGTVTRGGEGANRNRERHERIRTALTELAKFIPEGAQEVPGLPGRGAPVPHARPERCTRAWISGELAHWSELDRALPPSDLGGAEALLDQLGRDYDPRMTGRTIRYSTGNENNPADPFGRSELVLHADGQARLDHHFSREHRTGAWTGQVDAAAVGALWAALDDAGFPAVPGPPGRLPPDETLRTLIVEADGAARRADLGWHQESPQPGYGVAFDILDGVIRQLSGTDVPYPSAQPPIVGDITVLA